MSVEEDVVARVRHADPARTIDADPTVLSQLLRSAIAAPALEHAPAPRRKRRASVFIGAGAGLLALGIGAPAFADEVITFLAQTGWIGTSPNPGPQPAADSGAASTESDESEWISILAPDFVDYAVSIFPAYITVPDSYDRDRFAIVVPTNFQDSAREQIERDGSPGAVMQKTGVVRNYETAAQCVWMQEWLDADAVDDVPRRDAATIVIRQDATWPATVAVDGGGIVDSYLAVADAAEAGTPRPVQNEVDINCGAFWTFDEARK